MTEQMAREQIIQPVRTGMERFERRLESVLESQVGIVQLMVRHVLAAKGKGFRPILALLTARAIGSDLDRVIDAAVGIELLQTATLIHDDVIDSADTRRGAASRNAVWGNQVSVLMGDFLLAKALQILVGLDSQQVMEASTLATQWTVEGEMLEIERGNTALTEGVYLDIVNKKTSSLFSLACQVGAMLSGGSQEQIERMGAFGKLLGIAFQITDDVLDFTGDSTICGKPVGNDIKEKTITLPLIKALENCSNGEGEAIRDRIESGVESHEDWQEVLSFVHRYDGIEYARAQAHRFAADASQHLIVLSSSEERSCLELATRHAVERQR